MSVQQELGWDRDLQPPPMSARVLGAAGNDPQPVSVVGFGREDKEREEKGAEEEKEKEEEKEEEKVGE